MDYEAYRKKYFVQPPPEQKFAYQGLLGVTLYFEAYEEAEAYYTEVLGSPAYIEGDSTRGWQIGTTWFTLLRGRQGSPQNVEVGFLMESRVEADRLQQAFLAAGGTGPAPVDDLMYEPVHLCPVTDPFGTEILVYSRR